jgi:hypothetical protein
MPLAMVIMAVDQLEFSLGFVLTLQTSYFQLRFISPSDGGFRLFSLKPVA